MARDPLSLFTDALTQGLGAGRARGNDDLAMLQAQQQQQQWNEGRAARDADLRSRQLQNEASQFELENARRANSKRLAGEALLRMKSDPDWIHTPEGQRAISTAVNESPEYTDEGIEGFKTLGRDEARLMGMDDGVYSRIVAANHPDGVDDPNDRLVVPLRRGESGDLVPFDMDDQGNVTTYSMSRLNSVLQTLAGNPDAVGEAMGSLYTGQPGASVQAYGAPGGGGGGGSIGSAALAAPAAAQPAQRQSSAATTQDLISPAGYNGAMAVANGARQRDQAAMQPQPPKEPGLNGAGDAISSNMRKTISDAYARMFGKAGAEAATAVDPVEGESEETAVGRPASIISKDAQRPSRRVMEGKGISAAQAKQLADDPEQSGLIRQTEPTPRAMAGASANVMAGMQPRTGRGGAPEFTVGAGKKPSTKQLSSAALLMSAGVIAPEDLKRYADLGVISADGVSTMQQGMVSATSRANNYDSNATSVRNTDASNAAAMARTQYSEAAQNARFQYGQDREDRRLALRAGFDQQAAERKAAAASRDPVKQHDTMSATVNNLLDNEEYSASDGFIARAMKNVGFGDNKINVADMTPEERERFSSQIANAAIPALNAIPASARTPDDQLRYSDAALRLHNLAGEDNGALQRLGRILQFKPGSYDGYGWGAEDITTDPLAISLVANNSGILNENSGSAEDYYDTIAQPMASGLKEAGRANLINDPSTRHNIMSYVNSRLGRDAQRDGAGVWSDKSRIRQYIREATGAAANMQ